MNAIRKQVSGIKGGRLAVAAHPARVLTLVVSDVPGDDPAQVASGPTVPDPGTRAEARALVHSWRIELPPRVADWLVGDAGAAPDPADPVFAGHEVRVIASARLSLEAAAAQAGAAGIPAAILSDAMEGEARDVGRVHAAITRRSRRATGPLPGRCCCCRGRNHGFAARRRAWRAQQRIPAGAGAGRRGRTLCGAGGGYRRDRRVGR